MDVYKGTCTQNKITLPHIEYFKEEEVSEVLKIPNQKPDMENILSVIAALEIENIRLIDTEIGKSNEGQVISGKKLIVELRVKEKVTYVAEEISQSVHAAHYEYLKSFFVIIPNEVKGIDVCELLRSNRITVTPYVEAIQSRMIDERTIFKCLLIFIDVKFC